MLRCFPGDQRRQVLGNRVDRRSLEEESRSQRERILGIQPIGELGEGHRVESELAEVAIEGDATRLELENRGGEDQQAIADRGDRRRSARLFRNLRRTRRESGADAIEIAGGNEDLRTRCRQRRVERRQARCFLHRTQAQCRLHPLFGPAVDGHAAAAPERPVDRDRVAAPLAAAATLFALRGESVCEGVREGVVALTDVAGQRSDRGEDDERLQRIRGRGLVEPESPGDLRGDHRGHLCWLLLHQSRVMNYARSVDDDVDPSESLPRFGDEAPHVVLAADVGLHVGRVSAELAQRSPAAVR